MGIDPNTITYPRRRAIRRVLRTLIRAAFGVLSDFEVDGRENLPNEGPLLIVGNHFSFLDPVAMIGTMPYPMEFVGGTQTPNAPPTVSWFAKVYGVLPVNRGSVSRDTLKASRKVLGQKGVLGIFPEAGSWATVLRPARPGAAFLASSCDAHILPVGLDGLTEFFPNIMRGKRPKVTLRIGRPFGPFFVSERGESDRQKLADIGHEMMRRIADLLPAETRGHYSEDPLIRAAALGTEIYPWDGKPEIS
jgi:1-acyl-sn-glycerol-3-phosphate acyltransferase